MEEYYKDYYAHLKNLNEAKDFSKYTRQYAQHIIDELFNNGEIEKYFKAKGLSSFVDADDVMEFLYRKYRKTMEKEVEEYIKGKIQ